MSFQVLTTLAEEISPDFEAALSHFQVERVRFKNVGSGSASNDTAAVHLVAKLKYVSTYRCHLVTRQTVNEFFSLQEHRTYNH
jgi:hypothetical protein